MSVNGVRQNWLYWKKSLDVSYILEIAERETVSDASTFGGMNKDHRRSKVAWLTGNKKIMDMLWPYVNKASSVMNVDVYSSAEFQYTEYHGTNKGKYDWHHDVDFNKNDGRDRKFSVTVQLSDPSEYEGGAFEFKGIEQPSIESREKGTVLVFPSHFQHRVTPVTSGVRKSLVAWFEGPSWR